MKNKIIAAVLAVSFVGLVFGGFQAWQTQQVQQWAADAKQATVQKTLDEARAKKVQRQYQELNAQCLVGQASYDKQDAIYKKQNPRPVCDLELVQ